MKNIWSLIALAGLCASCTDPLDVPTREYISFHYPFFETIRFEQDKVFLTQYRPEIQGNTLQLSAQQGKVSGYERSEDSFFLESSIAPEGTGTLLTLKANGEVLGYGDRDYYSPTIPEIESISYDTFFNEIISSEFWNQGTLSASLNNELLELLENSKLVRIEELDADVERVKINYSLSKEEFNESRTHYSDDLGIGYISSTVFRPMEGVPSIFYNLTGEGDYISATTYMITSAESTLSFEEVSITQESVFHATHLVRQDLIGFSGSSETLLTEAEWDQEIDRLKLEAQERAVAEETARLEALEQQRLAAEAEEAARLEALEQQRLIAQLQEQRRLTAEVQEQRRLAAEAEAEAAAKNQVINFANGDFYIGELREGQPNGQGTLTFARGGDYVGEFKDGQRHGSGTRTFGNGNVHVGEFRDGEANGQGTYTYADGTVYIGEFRDSQRNGQGTYTYADGTVYIGEFRDGQFNGQGTYTYAEGDVYVGEFRDGEANEQGTYTFGPGDFEGDVYVGEFRDALFHGQGTLTRANGDIYVGEYRDGQRNGQGTLTRVGAGNSRANDSVYVGEFKDGNFNGQGTLTYTGGNGYVGEFKDGLRHGRGTLTLSTGAIRRGLWENDSFRGAN